jgi:epoxyqueuosine reductase
MEAPSAQRAEPEVTGDGASLARELKGAAHDLGFELCGIAPAVVPGGLHAFVEWIERGFAGEMHYLPRRKDAYHHPRFVLQGVRTIVMLGMNYNSVPPAKLQSAQTREKELTHGRVARYAWGKADYHDLIRERLHALQSWLVARQPGCQTRGVVDTAPLLERDFARLAGLGWFGKNTMLINKRLGSWSFLAAILTSADLACDQNHAASHCGSCSACLDACPTGAFVEPHVLDARRCISYLTIEHQGAISEDLRAGMGDWLFGCDVCQEVCPWNRKAPVTTEPAYLPQPATESTAIGATGFLSVEPGRLDAAALLKLTPAEFRARFKNTALLRPGRGGILRNAAIVLGNSRSPAAVAPLAGALADDEAVVRGAAAWALGQIANTEAAAALARRLQVETDPAVMDELQRALHQAQSSNALAEPADNREHECQRVHHEGPAGTAS